MKRKEIEWRVVIRSVGTRVGTMESGNKECQSRKMKEKKGEGEQ